MVPGKGRGRGTCYAGMQPMHSGAVPDIPNAAILNIALSTEDEFVRAVRLVHVKFNRLGKLRSRQVKIRVIPEVGDGVVTSQLLPPESIRVGSRTTDIELGRVPGERGRTLALLH